MPGSKAYDDMPDSPVAEKNGVEAKPLVRILDAMWWSGREGNAEGFWRPLTDITCISQNALIAQ